MVSQKSRSLCNICRTHTVQSALSKTFELSIQGGICTDRDFTNPQESSAFFSSIFFNRLSTDFYRIIESTLTILKITGNDLAIKIDGTSTDTNLTMWVHPRGRRNCLGKKRIDLVVFNDGGKKDELRTNDSNARSPTARLTEEARKTRVRKYRAPPKRRTCLLPFYITACSFPDVTERTSSSKDPCNDGLSKVSDRPTAQSSLTIWWEEHREILIVFFYILFFHECILYSDNAIFSLFLLLFNNGPLKLILASVSVVVIIKLVICINGINNNNINDNLKW